MINSHIQLDLDSVKSPFKNTTEVIVPSTNKDNQDKFISCRANDNNCKFTLETNPRFVEEH